jgi:hypothetical protein
MPDIETRTDSIELIGVAATDEAVGLYRRAFSEFGARALWNIQQFDQPTNKQVLAIARQLRTEGDISARRLAEQIEQAARADL